MVNRRKKQVSRRYDREMIGVFFLFVALFLLLCLVSYALPLLAERPALQEPATNWCGRFGFYTAHYLYSFLGCTAFVPVLILVTVGMRALFTQDGLNRLPWVVAGISGLVLSCSGLLAIGKRLVLPPEFVQPGGYLGELVWRISGGVLGAAGSVLFLCLLLIFSLMAAVRFSPAAALTSLVTGFARLRRTIGSLAVRPRRSPPAAPRTKEPRVELGPRPSAAVERDPRVGEEKSVPEPRVHEPLAERPESNDADEEFAFRPTPAGEDNYRLPPLSLLDRAGEDEEQVDREHFLEVSRILVAKLRDFGVQGSVEGISPGPVVTTYEFSPAAGVKITKVVGLADDLAMALRVDRVRIVGSIPGKAALGIEIPNPVRRKVYLRDILLSDAYRQAGSLLTLGLGFDVIGRPVAADLARMPHLLIAGATGAGKSVAINAFIASILFKATPADVRLLMIDPKRIELSVYEGIPHLLHPVVVEPKMASRALLWAVKEMERRYLLLEEMRVKSFDSYNRVAEEKLPYIVIIVDELADLMMVASKDVETSIARLAQMARAAGMHIILATQRPSVDVLTGLIKANFPTRISFKVSSKVDSRTILDSSGAEHLLGMGDMLFLPPGAAKLQRIHGAFISEEETERIISFLKEQGSADYDSSVLEVVENESGGETGEKDEADPLYDEAVAVVTETGQASISMVQRRLRVGYNRAARMIEMMEREGIVGPADGSRPREVLVRRNYEG